MKSIGALALLLCLLSTGCMTSAVIYEAQRDPQPIHSLAKEDPVTGEMKAPLDYPKANYILLPFAIPADIITSPFQLVMLMLWPDC